MQQLLAEVRRAQSRLSSVRTSAREEAVSAIRSLEARLVETLAGEPLRGMPNLLPDAPKQFYALQIRGRSNRYLSLEGRAELVLLREAMVNSAGEHVMLAWAVRDAGSPMRPFVSAIVSPVADEEFNAEDLARVIEVVQGALQAHLARIASTEVTYARADDLARRLKKVLAPSFT